MKTITKHKVLKKHDRCCEGKSGTDFRWAYTSCYLVEKLNWHVTKVPSMFLVKFLSTLSQKSANRRFVYSRKFEQIKTIDGELPFFLIDSNRSSGNVLFRKYRRTDIYTSNNFSVVEKWFSILPLRLKFLETLLKMSEALVHYHKHKWVLAFSYWSRVFFIAPSISFIYLNIANFTVIRCFVFWF